MMFKKTTDASRLVFNVIAKILVFCLVAVCTAPFLMVVSGSFSSNAAIMQHGYSLLPRDFSLDAYRTLFRNPEILGRSYLVSIFVTAAGTLTGLVVMSMAGYALQRSSLKYRNGISFFIYFTTLFGSGLVPWYMLICNLGMKNTIWVLILPCCTNAFHILLIRNYMRGIPPSLVESAKIDGAGEFYTFIRIILPLAQPILVTVGLFLALDYWNNWFMASLFIKDASLWPLQYRLYKLLTEQSMMMKVMSSSFANTVLPTETVKLANAVIATGPIVLLYPFLQKYFVQGITIGAVKG